MSVSLVVNGVTFVYPETGDEDWGGNATNWASAVTSGMLQKAGGTFTLTAEVDFGATYGLKTAYYKTQTANIASTGEFRLAQADTITWRNAANGADLDLAVSADVLQFNGEAIIAGLIVNADIDAAAAIAFSKMEALTVSRALVSDGSGVVGVSSVTSTELGYVSGVTSALQTQLDAKLPLSGGTMTGTLTLNGDPSSDLQAATKQYVDNVSAGNVNNFTVRLATTAAVNLANELEDGDTLDGVVIATGDLILVKNQASTADNGIYVAPASGAASRYSGMDTWTEAIGATVFVTEGTVNAGTQWKFNTAAGGTLGVTDIPIVQYNASQVYTADGQGIELSGSQFALELNGSTLSKSSSGLQVASGGITNTEVNASAGIAVSKLAALTASRAVVTDGSGFASAATTTAAEIGYVNGVTSAIQTQLDARLALAGGTMTGDLTLNGDPDSALKAAPKQYVDNNAAVKFSASEVHLDTGNGFGSVGTCIRRFSNVRKNTGSNLTLTQSSTNGDKITVNADGVYTVYVEEYGDSAGRFFGISVNASSLTTGITSLTYANGRRNVVYAPATQPMSSAMTLSLSSGDVIRFQGSGSATSTNVGVSFQVCQCAEF